MPWYLPNADHMQWGPSDFDHKHRMVLSWVWDLPKVGSSNGFVKHVVNGWQWTGIGQYQTGSPFNIKSGGDNSQTGLGNDRPKLTGVSPDAQTGADKRVGFSPAAFAVNHIGTFGDLGRNVFYGPHLFNFDIEMFKTFAITERLNTQFRAEMFNIFNSGELQQPQHDSHGRRLRRHHQHQLGRRLTQNYSVRSETGVLKVRQGWADHAAIGLDKHWSQTVCVFRFRNALRLTTCCTPSSNSTSALFSRPRTMTRHS